MQETANFMIVVEDVFAILAVCGLSTSCSANVFSKADYPIDVVSALTRAHEVGSTYAGHSDGVSSAVRSLQKKPVVDVQL
jgi:adenosine/AMP kinase